MQPRRLRLSSASGRARPDRRRRFRRPKPAFAPPSSSASRRWAAPACCRAPFRARRCANRRCAIAACRAAHRRWRSSCAAMRRCRPCCTASTRSSPRRTAICRRSSRAISVELIRGRGVFLDAHRIEVQRLDGSRSVLQCAAHAARHRIAAAACAGHRSRSRAHSRQRLHLEPAVHSALHGGAGQRRHRLRVRLHLRRAGLRRDAARQGGGAAGVSRPCAAHADFSRRFRPWAASTAAAPKSAARASTDSRRSKCSCAAAQRLTADIVFAAFGRVANLDGIGLDRLQLAISSRGHVQVNERFETNIPGIFAAGDAIGPPALACAAADQGRRAALAALGLPPPAPPVWCRAACTRFRRSPASACRRARPRRRKSMSSSAAPTSAKSRAPTSRASPRVS